MSIIRKSEIDKLSYFEKIDVLENSIINAKNLLDSLDTNFLVNTDFKNKLEELHEEMTDKLHEEMTDKFEVVNAK